VRRLKDIPDREEVIRLVVGYALSHVDEPFDYTATATLPFKMNEGNLHCAETGLEVLHGWGCGPRQRWRVAGLSGRHLFQSEAGQTMRAGVFGGTFDPIHLGHLAAARSIQTTLKLDKVIFVPAGQPWMKAGTKISPVKDR